VGRLEKQLQEANNKLIVAESARRKVFNELQVSYHVSTY
jgi:hypothetical protein